MGLSDYAGLFQGFQNLVNVNLSTSELETAKETLTGLMGVQNIPGFIWKNTGTGRTFALIFSNDTGLQFVWKDPGLVGGVWVEGFNFKFNQFGAGHVINDFLIINKTNVVPFSTPVVPISAMLNILSDVDPDANASCIGLKKGPLGLEAILDVRNNASARIFHINSDGTRITLGAGGVLWLTGAGTPENAVVAPVGSLYTDTAGGAGTTLYVKESGVGNTGWIAK